MYVCVHSLAQVQNQNSLQLLDWRRSAVDAAQANHTHTHTHTQYLYVACLKIRKCCPNKKAMVFFFGQQGNRCYNWCHNNGIGLEKGQI